MLRFRLHTCHVHDNTNVNTGIWRVGQVRNWFHVTSLLLLPQCINEITVSFIEGLYNSTYMISYEDKHTVSSITTFIIYHLLQGFTLQLVWSLATTESRLVYTLWLRSTLCFGFGCKIKYVFYTIENWPCSDMLQHSLRTSVKVKNLFWPVFESKPWTFSIKKNVRQITVVLRQITVEFFCDK